jgi:DNA-binding CsgD family transcriptional regulator
MLAYRGEGYSLADIGRKFGISRQRVWTILHNYRTKDELANR